MNQPIRLYLSVDYRERSVPGHRDIVLYPLSRVSLCASDYLHFNSRKPTCCCAGHPGSSSAGLSRPFLPEGLTRFQAIPPSIPRRRFKTSRATIPSKLCCGTAALVFSAMFTGKNIISDNPAACAIRKIPFYCVLRPNQITVDASGRGTPRTRYKERRWPIALCRGDPAGVDTRL